MARTDEITSFKPQQQNVRVLKSLRMFEMFTLRFKTSFGHFGNFFTALSIGPRGRLSQMIFDDRFGLRMTLVIASNVAPQPWYKHGSGPVNWSPLVFGKIIWTSGSEQVRVTNFKSTNKREIRSSRFCFVASVKS